MITQTTFKLGLLGALGALLVACSGGPQAQHVRASDNHASFDATHRFEIAVPEGAKQLRAWLPLPAGSDPHQEVSQLEITVEPVREYSIRPDTRGNEFLVLEVDAAGLSKLTVETRFRVKRYEVVTDLDAPTRPHTGAELAELASDLVPGSQTQPTPEIEALAKRAVGDETDPIVKARAIYDAVLEHVEYHVKDPKPNATKSMNSSGKGSALYTFEQCTGNCTDFHALYAAMSRSVGLPTRAVYGSFFKGPLDGVDKDQSYHCWLEIHIPDVGWLPLDVAVADVFVADFAANEHSKPRANLTVADGYEGPDPAMVDYYFGNLEARRVVWHRGRDLVLDPRQAGDPLPWNPKGYCEVDGASVKVSRKLTFKQVK